MSAQRSLSLLSFFVVIGWVVSLANACSPMQATDYSSKDSYIDMTTPSAGGQGTNPSLPTAQPLSTHSIEVGGQLNLLNTLGELDLVKAAADCSITSVFRLTVLDADGERAIFSLSLNPAITIEQLMNQIQIRTPATSKGDKLDLFACLDHNNDGRCADEPVRDINAISAILVADRAQRTQNICAQLNAGLVILHSPHYFGPAGTVSAMSTLVTQTMQQRLANLAPQAVTTNGNITIFALAIAVANPALAQQQQQQGGPPMREYGCFAKETEIAISPTVRLPIEKLKVGMKVFLADGRYSPIKKIVAGPEAERMIEFKTLTGQKVFVTTKHPMLTRQGLKKAEDVTMGDELKIVSGEFVGLASATRRAYKEKVYNFELEGTLADADHLVIADEVITGDLYLQNSLSSRLKLEQATAGKH